MKVVASLTVLGTLTAKGANRGSHRCWRRNRIHPSLLLQPSLLTYPPPISRSALHHSSSQSWMGRARSTRVVWLSCGCRKTLLAVWKRMKNVLLIVGAASSLYILQAVRRPFQTHNADFLLLHYKSTNAYLHWAKRGRCVYSFDKFLSSCVFFYDVIVIWRFCPHWAKQGRCEYRQRHLNQQLIPWG